MTGEAEPRVVVLGLNYAPEHTGIAPYTTALARHLAQSGLKVTALVGTPHYPQWQVHEGYEQENPVVVDEGVRLRRSPHPVPPSGAGLRRVLMEAVFAVRVGARLLRTPADAVVVVSPSLLSVIPALISGRFRGHRVGVIAQDLYGAALAETGMGGGIVSRLTVWLERHLLRRADAVVVIHEVFRQRLLAEGVAAAGIEVIPNWTHVVIPEHVDRGAVRSSLGWGPDDVIALHAGNMGVKQGLEGLLAAGRLAAETGSRVRVVLMGDGSQRAALEAAAAGIEQVEFLDPLPAGPFETALAAADVLVLHEKPGVVEMSVPSKLTSYFAAGRPVVAATDPLSGAAALVRASRGGVITESGDARALLDAVHTLAQPDVAAEAGARGRSFAERNLSGESSLGAYRAWVGRLLQPS